jgi:hypothetical protein
MLQERQGHWHGPDYIMMTTKRLLASSAAPSQPPAFECSCCFMGHSLQAAIDTPPHPTTCAGHNRHPSNLSWPPTLSLLSII